jgi:D-cysteine desulfhydrase family pyridoxal phosphate-dependent enzyme
MSLIRTPSGPEALRVLEGVPRLRLAHLPTPLEFAPRLGAALGLPHLLVKRDDCTGLALGGNKARKLEYLLYEARANAADTLITTGGAQSNHARMTAAAACRLGMRAILVLADDPPREVQGNLLIDRLCGAEVRLEGDVSAAEMALRMERLAAALREQGHRPYIIPVGGSTPLGCLGYARAVAELAEQAAALDVRVDAMVVATGSTGTLAGMLLGAAAWLPGVRLYGISVSPPAPAGRSKAFAIADTAAQNYGLPLQAAGPEEVCVEDRWLGPGYGVPTPEGVEAMRLAARTEGLILDPVYTAKALAGLRALAAEGILQPRETVVFWHTGGAPALFAHETLVVEERSG